MQGLFHFKKGKKKESKPRRKQGNTKTALPLVMGMAVSSLRRQISPDEHPPFGSDACVVPPETVLVKMNRTHRIMLNLVLLPV